MSVTAKAESFSDELLNTEHVAVRLGVSSWTVSRWRVKGTGPAWRRIGPKRVVYSAADVNAFLSKAS
jgi:predicted DNA-binding transcriptional regulator AlpA